MVLLEATGDAENLRTSLTPTVIKLFADADKVVSGRVFDPLMLAAPLPGEQAPNRTASGRPIRRRRDPLRHHRAIVGRDARIRWWERVRALVVLIVMVVLLGALAAIFVGFMIFLGTVLLEVLAG